MNQHGWLWLTLAIISEIAWVVGLKYTEGFTRLWPSVFTIPMSVASVVFLSFAVRSLPLGTAYAIWTGTGAVGVATIGILWLHEPAGLLRLGSLVLVILGLVGLKMATH